MRMKDFHCGTFEVSFDVGAKEIKTNALIKEVGGERQEEIDLYLIFDSKENPGEQHSHIGIQSKPDNKVGVRISYHDSQGKAEDDKPPYMEDCAKWLSKFIKPDKVKAAINATYFFDKDYATCMKLPYPLRTSGKGLKGGLVTGLSMQFPADSQLDYAIIQRSPDASIKEFALSVGKSEEIAVKAFDIYEELKRLETPLTTLVKKRARSHEKRDEK